MKKIFAILILGLIPLLGFSQTYKHSTEVRLETVTQVLTPVGTMQLLIRDISDQNKIKYITLGDLGLTTRADVVQGSPDPVTSDGIYNAINQPNGIIAVGAINGDKLVDNSVNGTKILNNSVDSAKLSDTGATAGNYTNADVTINSKGQITSITSGTAVSTVASGQGTTIDATDPLNPIVDLGGTINEAVSLEIVGTASEDEFIEITGTSDAGEELTMEILPSSVSVEIVDTSGNKQFNEAVNVGTSSASFQQVTTTNEGGTAENFRLEANVAGSRSIRLDASNAALNNTTVELFPSELRLRTPNVDGGTAVVNQVLTLQNAASGQAEYTTISTGPGSDTDAIHDNVANEFATPALKVTPADADVLLIEDSEDSFNKKRIRVDAISSGGGSVAQTTGTFTPTLIDIGGGATYSLTVTDAEYVKTGRQVWFTMHLSSISTTGVPSGQFQLQGMPFNNANGTQTVYSVGIFTGSDQNFYTIHGQHSVGTTVVFRTQDALDGSFGTTILSSNTMTGGLIIMSGVYETAD